MVTGILKIDILGTSFTIQAEESAEYLDVIYNRYKTVIEELERTSPIRDPLRLSILAGILLSDEVQKKADPIVSSRVSQQTELIEVEKLALKMINSIDSIL
ncbi:MAG: cell division protein ZapA [Treponemataceae bacterium]